MELKRQEKVREDGEKAKYLQLEIKLENTLKTTQQKMFKMQSNTTAVMQQVLTSVLSQTIPLDKYQEFWASIAAMFGSRRYHS